VPFFQTSLEGAFSNIPYITIDSASKLMTYISYISLLRIVERINSSIIYFVRSFVEATMYCQPAQQ
jgi:hypothetical protein